MDYPAIVKLAKQQGAEIHWGDEIRLRADDQTGCSDSKRGQTPVVSGTGQRFGCNLLLTLTHHRTLYFKLFTQAFNVDVMLQFLHRLIRQISRKVFLIVDKHPVHLSAKVNRSLEQHAERIRMFLLPSYRPELDPDELLNHNIKANTVGQKRTKTRLK